jgi:16S rRNA pseudouridine516 synthase
MSELLRLDQLLSRFGYCSRREAQGWIRDGLITLNGAPLTRPEQRLDPATVLVKGRPVEFPDGLRVAFHKPAGVVCSHNPAEGTLIYDLLPPSWMRRQPPPATAGRLDKETSGLILISDDGAFIHRWTSPKHDIVKTYEVAVDREFPAGLAELLAAGTLQLHGEAKPCLPAQLEITGPRAARLHIREGKYHQVRRMFASQGCAVTGLHRTRTGGIELGDLAPGQWRPLSEEELA